MSWQMKAIARYLQLTRKPRYATAAAGAARLAEPKSSAAPPARVTRRCDVEHATVNTFDVYTVRPPHAQSSTAGTASIIYLHGGAYVGEIQPSHWNLIAELATQLHCPVITPIYGLAPDYHVEQALDLIHAVLFIVTGSGPTYLVGDSAGGGLALSATQTWLTADRPAVRGLTLIAPWLDAGLSNPAIDDVEGTDPWLSRPGLNVCATSWAGAVSLNDPRVSPLFGDMTTVPPIDLYVGDRDITVADCRLLRDRLSHDHIRYHEERGAVHVYPLLPTPESRAARRDMIAHIKTALAHPGR